MDEELEDDIATENPEISRIETFIEAWNIYL